MSITMQVVRDRLLPGLVKATGDVNRLWVQMQHGKECKLISRRRWIERWRADKLGLSGVRARRVVVQATTKVAR
jgi:hypothetical protein